jgi:hypothetical protein
VRHARRGQDLARPRVEEQREAAPGVKRVHGAREVTFDDGLQLGVERQHERGAVARRAVLRAGQAKGPVRARLDRGHPARLTAEPGVELVLEPVHAGVVAVRAAEDLRRRVAEAVVAPRLVLDVHAHQPERADPVADFGWQIVGDPAISAGFLEAPPEPADRLAQDGRELRRHQRDVLELRPVDRDAAHEQVAREHLAVAVEQFAALGDQLEPQLLVRGRARDEVRVQPELQPRDAHPQAQQPQ